MERLDDFQRIIILKCLRPDKITDAMQDYVAAHTGQRFIEPQVTICYSFIYFLKSYNSTYKQGFLLKTCNL